MKSPGSDLVIVDGREPDHEVGDAIAVQVDLDNPSACIRLVGTQLTGCAAEGIRANERECLIPIQAAVAWMNERSILSKLATKSVTRSGAETVASPMSRNSKTPIVPPGQGIATAAPEK